MKVLVSRLRQPDDVNKATHAWLGALGGIALFGLSLVFIIGGFQMGVGSPLRLGTGAFPVLTGLALAALSITIMLLDMQDIGEAERPDWVSFVAIGAALAVFAIVSERFGLIPAVFLTTIVASLPDPSLKMPGKLALGAVVSLGCWGLFIGLLDLPFQAIRGF